MTARSENLASRFDRAVSTFLGTVEGLSPDQWRAACPSDGRPVGVVTHHVASAIAFEMSVFREIAAGRQPAAITTAWLDEVNARDAENWADVPMDETLALLRRNAAAAASEVRQLLPEQLGRAGEYLAAMEALTVEAWLDQMLIGHVYEHLECIRAAVASGNAERPR